MLDQEAAIMAHVSSESRSIARQQIPYHTTGKCFPRTSIAQGHLLRFMTMRRCGRDVVHYVHQLFQ